MQIFCRNFLKFRIVNHNLINRRYKYIVLLPELPLDTAENNPLLRANVLPAFSQITTEKCVGAVGKLVIEYESGIHQLDQKFYDANFQRNAQNVILPLDRLTGPLDFAWGAFKLLYSVRQDGNTFEAYMKLHPRIVKAKREKYLSTSIYSAFKEMKENSKQFTEPVQRVIDKHILESQLSGMDLVDKSYKHFQDIMFNLDNHRRQYKTKLQKSSSLFSHNLEFSDVENFPRDLLELLVDDPSNIKKGPWTLTLQPKVYTKFLEYCNRRILRWNVWSAWNMRASSMSGEDLNNGLEVEEIRYQRRELAKLLGYDTFADLSMKTKMAGSVENVMSMITTIHVKSVSTVERELGELQAFANHHGFQEKLELWDIPFWQRLHKEEILNVDDDVIRHYFPLPSVLSGVFKLFQKLFNITIKEVKDVDVWHEDVSYYKIYDENDKEIASFYFDPYFREEKSVASCIEIGSNRSDVTGSQPLSYLIFNFQPPFSGKPSLLSFSDLKNFLDKCGHLLQHSLTTVPYSDVSGITNLEWDVVNVCPLVMKSFVKHYNFVADLSCHVDSGKILPPELHEILIKRDNYMIGLKLAEHLYLSALDLEFYRKSDYWLAITKNVWNQYMPFPYEKNSAQPCSFPEIFSDNYPAAYFSNLWAEMIAADIFSAFEEEGLNDDEKMQQIGKRFRDTYLSLGGGSYPGEVFRKFRGRDPCTDALLVSYGLMHNNS